VTGHGLTSDTENAGSGENGLDTSQLVRKIYKLFNSTPEAFLTIFLFPNRLVTNLYDMTGFEDLDTGMACRYSTVTYENLNRARVF